MDPRRIIKNACIITMDPTLGTLERGDILIEGAEIREVAPDIPAGGAEVIDGSGTIALPGLVDAHRHLWHTPLRTTGADDTNLSYFVHVLLGSLASYRPEDVYIATYAGALEALEAGVTTVVDFADCMLSPDHADEAVRAHQGAGVRSIFCYGFQGAPIIKPGKPLDLKNAFMEPETLFPDAKRARRGALSSDDALVTMGISTSGLEGHPLEGARRQLELGRELGLRTITAHVAMETLSQGAHLVQDLGEAGLLGPDLLFSHANSLTDHELDLIAEAGAAIVASPENEMSDGWRTVTARALERGIPVSLGVDSVTYVRGDLFRQMRIGLVTERTRIGREAIERGLVMSQMTFPTRVGLELATIGGARALGLDHLIGSLTPGKQADIVLVRCDRLGLAPVNDPERTIVMMASAGDVDSVLIGGSPVKREGRLLNVDLPAVLNELEASRDHLEAAVRDLDMDDLMAQAAQLFPVE